MRIEIINVQQTSKPTAKGGTYQQLDVAYKNLDFQGRVEGKKIMSFNYKDTFAALSKATNGQIYDITKVKEGEYWQWSNAILEESQGTTNSATTVSKASPSPKSTYETPEERALRQRMIVRQSSISNAIETLKVEKKVVDTKDVIKVAQVYFDWVMDNGTKNGTDFVADIADMQDDIPM